MTNERKKAILTLLGTLIIGVLLGMLLPGLFHKIKQREHRGHEQHDRDSKHEHKKDWFAETIHRVVKPDSIQSKQIRPVIEWASKQIDSVERSSNHGLSAILDSVKTQLKPMISEEQFKRLNEFDSKAKGRWGNRKKGKRSKLNNHSGE